MPNVPFLKQYYMPLEVKCLNCGDIIRGRSDKKFCNDGCRSTYNNALNGGNPIVRKINNALGKNRRILQQLLSPGKNTMKVNREKLLFLGFEFRYITGTYSNKAGQQYYYCYDYGYLSIEKDLYLIVKRKR
jgi:hypothetical protein